MLATPLEWLFTPQFRKPCDYGFWEAEPPTCRRLALIGVLELGDRDTPVAHLLNEVAELPDEADGLILRQLDRSVSKG